jgi:hypothetical protein
MRIESGPTVERRVRTAIPLLMTAVFAVWFAYDGWKGYPRKNFEENLLQLPADERARAQNAPIYPNVSEKLVTPVLLEKTERELKKAVGLLAKRKVLEGAFGGPPSWESANAWYYFGPTYRVKVTLDEGGLPVALAGRATEKSDTDLFWQRVLGAALAVGALALLIVMVRVVRTHLVLDDFGLAFRGQRPIRWEDMKALRADEFSRKGWVDLVYADNGAERCLRLDEYHLARFSEVIDAICVKMGFANPLPVDARSPSDRP